MIYDTGDSFGREEGLLEVIHVFKDKELADRAREKFVGETKKFSIAVEVEGGRTLKLTNPGAGYFKYVKLVDIEGCLINP